MRITRESLHKLARNTVAIRIKTGRRPLCAYLTGSLLSEEPLLGGATDVDLVFVHDRQPEISREVSRVTNEVHLDIAHVSQAMFTQTRRLRSDPWFGSFLCSNPIILHDTQHWLEFTQASVCSQFHDPQYVVSRARSLAERSRLCWLEMSNGGFPEALSRAAAYLDSLEKAANAIACLSGPPLTERRFLLQFPQRTERVGRPGLASGLIDLYLSTAVEEDTWQRWVENWRRRFQDSARLKRCPPSLSACRQSYYEGALKALRQEYPEASMWILLRIWTRTLLNLPENETNQKVWKEACRLLELDEDHFEQRLEGLDAYLDNIEETIDLWAEQYGV